MLSPVTLQGIITERNYSRTLGHGVELVTSCVLYFRSFHLPLQKQALYMADTLEITTNCQKLSMMMIAY